MQFLQTLIGASVFVLGAHACVKADVKYTLDNREMVATVVDNGERICLKSIHNYDIMGEPKEDEMDCFTHPDHQAKVRNMGGSDQREIFYSSPGASETLALNFRRGPNPISDFATGKTGYVYGRNEWC